MCSLRWLIHTDGLLDAVRISCTTMLVHALYKAQVIFTMDVCISSSGYCKVLHNVQTYVVILWVYVIVLGSVWGVALAKGMQ